jgi:hypothetical protein
VNSQSFEAMDLAMAASKPSTAIAGAFLKI